MSKHQTLDVWHRARKMTVQLHRAFPPHRAYLSPGLRGQVLRASASIAANVAEGASQSTNAEYARYVGYAIASTSETESHLELAIDLGAVVVDDRDFLDETRQIRRMLYGLQRTILSRPDPPKRRRKNL